jgi:hypothetical protein
MALMRWLQPGRFAALPQCWARQFSQQLCEPALSWPLSLPSSLQWCF